MSMTRREGLLAIAGVVAGGIVANATNFAVTTLGRDTSGPPPVTAFEPTGLGMGWVLSDADLEELGALGTQDIDASRFEVTERLDYLGGDVAAFRAVSSGDCAAACDSDPACTRFTYATTRHETTAKRKMCWLKNDEIESSRENAGAYISGQKR
ncbi:MAG: PAN/Apple domain-containing protein [Hyphomonadaceae bacterium]|nr:PAN/Apple domain-containing protein [Hyphomonadaceae bacterium]